MKKFKEQLEYLNYYAVIPFVSCFPFFFLSFTGISPWINALGVPVLNLLVYCVLSKKLNYNKALSVNGIAVIVLSVIFTLMMIIAKGNIEGVFMMNFLWFIFPFAPIMLVAVLMDKSITIIVSAFITYLSAFLYCLIKTRIKIRNLLIYAMCVLLCAASSGYLFFNRPSVKYGGHGFEYMHGFSSTDFSDYTVYAKNSKLVTLDHKASLIISDEKDMPVLDGAEACYPLYAAFAKAVYKDIDKIEESYLDSDSKYHNGKIVSFTNTVFGFNRLLNDDNAIKYGDSIDMFFGARPSKEQLDMAKEYNVELDVCPIGKEAFVFFVEKDNPVDNLSSEQIKAIYHGDIDNWSMLGGKNEKITAFQRPANSGSQTMMVHFMNDVTLKDPDTYEMVDAMGGVIKKVAQYANEKGAIGYTFRYFLEELNEEKGVKILSVDGVYPTLETIENNTYPLVVDLCVITKTSSRNPYVEKMKEFILSDDGQKIIRETGYGTLISN